MSKLKKHYILLFLAIAMIACGFIFYFYTKEEVYELPIVLGFYFLGYTWLWLHTYYHWSKNDNNLQKNITSKRIYSVEKMLVNFVLFIIIFFITLLLYAIVSQFFVANLIPTYLFLMYALFIFLMVIPVLKFVLQDKYVVNKKKINWAIVFVNILLLLSLYFDIKGWNNNTYYNIFRYISYLLSIEFVRSFYGKSKK